MTAQTEGPDIEARPTSGFARILERGAVGEMQLSGVFRAIILGVIGVATVARIPFPSAGFYLAILVLFLVLGIAHRIFTARRPEAARLGYVFVTLDILLLAFALICPNPLAEVPSPPQMALGSGNFAYFYLLLAGASLANSTRHVLWTGLGTAILWSAAAILLIVLPNTVTMLDYANWTAMPLFARVDAMRQPNFIDLPGVVRDVGLIVLVTLLLASVIWQMQRLASMQTDIELQRANLARYFSPNLVDEMTRNYGAFRTEVEQDAAVMFLDMRGFTAFAEQLRPHITLEILRSFHLRMSQQVFAHDGTLDKFIGDGLMATFGVPKKGPRDASNAIACALAMRDSITEWNRFRERSEYPPIEIGLGIHYGPVVMGDIGSHERMEFAVIGDTVNIASRLEQLSRKLGTDIVLGDDVVAAAHEEIGSDHTLFDGFRESPEQALRGRLTGKIVWVHDETTAQEDRTRRLGAVDLAPGAA